MGSTRSVTLIFGAREERDLYALDEIEAIRAVYKGEFRVVHVLSESHDDAWQGERGS